MFLELGRSSKHGRRDVPPPDVEVVGCGDELSLRRHGDVAERAEALGVFVTVSLTHPPNTEGAVAVRGRSPNRRRSVPDCR
jgi:hypothetical protein